MIRRGDDDDEDRKRVLRDGERLRVPLWMMDSTQREIAERWRQSVTAQSTALVTDAFSAAPDTGADQASPSPQRSSLL